MDDAGLGLRGVVYIASDAICSMSGTRFTSASTVQARPTRRDRVSGGQWWSPTGSLTVKHQTNRGADKQAQHATYQQRGLPSPPLQPGEHPRPAARSCGLFGWITETHSV